MFSVESAKKKKKKKTQTIHLNHLLSSSIMFLLVYPFRVLVELKRVIQI